VTHQPARLTTGEWISRRVPEAYRPGLRPHESRLPPVEPDPLAVGDGMQGSQHERHQQQAHADETEDRRAQHADRDDQRQQAGPGTADELPHGAPGGLARGTQGRPG
jgi:hypothetical protein